LFRPRTVSLHGTSYRVGAIVFVGYVDELPAFASIQGIFVLGAKKIYFIVKKLETIMFSSHFHSYEVGRPAHADVCDLTNLELVM
jgi:hypothetical protein